MGCANLKEDKQKNIYHKELDTILRFGALINSSLNIDNVLDSAMQWAEEFMDAEASTVYELDAERDELFIRLARGEKKDPIKNIRLKVGEGISGSVVQTGKPEVIQDVSKDKRFSDKFDRLTGFKTRSMICVPLILRDKAIGVLQVINKKSREPFTRSDLELLVGMSQQIGVAMENAKLYQRLEKKFELTEQELKTTQAKLIRSERLMAMGHLVQGIAHEIRNPIMTIGGFAHRIKKELREDNRLNKYIDIIMDELARLEKLVREVHEFADVQSATLSPDSIVDVIDEVSKKFEPLTNRQGVKLEMDIPEDPPLIKMDMTQLVNAMSNIFENALESMPDGGTLALKVSRENHNLLVAVRDTGYGIPKEQLDAIYDPFVSSKPRGAGLGLTMVYQIIMNHHGEIKITSDLDKGTLVTIRLPINSG